MTKFADKIESNHQTFMAKQQMFFIATAPDKGRVNLSPKGLDCFKVISPNRVVYRDLTGSGNETSAHLNQNGRITIMFCAFEGNPLILRLYGMGHAVTAVSPDWEEYTALFGDQPTGIRQFMVIDVESVQSSCGFGVPLYEYQGERDNLTNYLEKIGDDGAKEFQDKNNTVSIDGLEPFPLRGSKLSGEFKLS
ncbi:MAG: pyridoxamine 5'-phosphate oxidase family protein [Rhodospirillales bacterium]|nr:pyridoxamine 5'-phosphate oxidase family protein [Rhodospirillales bacterium]